MIATDNQFRFLRDLYAPSIGWKEANRWVQIMRVRKVSKEDASKEIERLLKLKMRGQYREPLDYTKEHLKEEDDKNFNNWWDRR